MPRRSKRLRLQKTEFNVDPLEFGVHEHLHELIFQHFDPADVLILSEVNKVWFDTIGRSRKCMQQINLGLDNWWQTETSEDMARIMKVVSKTTRRYQNVHLNSNDDALVSRKACQLLKTLAPSIVDLRFLNADYVSVREGFKFPRLERLQFINNVSDIDKLLLQASTQLKELNLKHHYFPDPQLVMDCLRANKHLKILKLWDSGISKLFALYEPNCFEFRLRRFATGADGAVSNEAESNFLHFLDKQSNCLEAIRFRSGLDGVGGTIINKVFEMSAMRIIHLDGVGDLKHLNLNVNPAIVELRMSWTIDTLEKLIPFIRAAPKVETLFLRKVNKDILEYVAVHLKELKTLYFTRSDGCIGCFKKFLSTNEDTNKDIRLVAKEWY